MNASDVYWTLTDQSFKVNGSTSLVGIVPMCTIKGDLKKLNLVTAQTLEDVLGYDLSYNGNYLGLQKMLNAVSYLYVMRINKDPYVANCYDASAAAVGSYATLEDGASLEELITSVGFQLNYAGKEALRHFVKLVPAITTKEYSVPEPAEGFYTVALTSAISLTAKAVTVGSVSYPIGILDADTLVAVGTSGGKVYSVSNGVVGDTEIGTCTTNSLVLNVADITFSGTKLSVVAHVAADQTYTFYHAVSSDGVAFTVKTKVDFTLDSTSESYWENVDFGEIVPTFKGNSINYNLFADYVELLNGSNGTMPTASDIDFTEFNKSSANICVLMGMTSISLLNAFIKQSETLLRSCFVGAPELSTFAAVKDWASTLYATEYRQLAWISDIEETSVGDVYISPAVNLFLIYAQMLADYSNLNYPPAGYTTGVISITKLMDTDFNLFRNELKTDKINYQWVGPRGPVMWEQRTGYPLETDLAYANTVFIIRDLRSQIMDFSITQNFRYTGPSDLTVFGKGLDDILRGMKDAGFLSAYTLVVPTFAEAQKQGRKLTIKIGIAVTQDSEEIWFDVVLNNYSDIAA